MARFLLLIVFLAACAPRGEITLAPQALLVGDVQTVFVGTTRKTDPKTKRYGTERSEEIQYARYDVSVPPNREPGEIKFPRKGAKGNPITNFLTTAEMLHPTQAAFRRGRVGLLPGVVLTVQNATPVVLSPVAAIARQ